MSLITFSSVLGEWKNVVFLNISAFYLYIECCIDLQNMMYNFLNFVKLFFIFEIPAKNCKYFVVNEKKKMNLLLRNMYVIMCKYAIKVVSYLYLFMNIINVSAKLF